MQHDHENPTLSVVFGSIFGLATYISQNGFIIDMSLELLKVCVFGFMGGVFGLLGKRFWEYLTRKKD